MNKLSIFGKNRNAVVCRIYGVRNHHKAGSLLCYGIHALHLEHHFRADGRTSGEKEISNINFILKVFLCYGISILINKFERRNGVINGICSFFSFNHNFFYVFRIINRKMHEMMRSCGHKKIDERGN